MDIATLYKTYRTPLFSLAYRMLGSVMDAEDIVQEAFLAYDQLADRTTIQNERAFLYKIVTNRCLDLLRSSHKKRELYVGPWLPEPLIERGSMSDGDPASTYLQHESISTAYLLLLQQLNAVERAIFLLREIFDYSYEEIAYMVGKRSANCRQIYSRAKKSFDHHPNQAPSISVAETQIKEFIGSLLQGNRSRLLELVSSDVVFLSDGGGKVKASLNPVIGFKAVISVIGNLLKLYEGQYSFEFVEVNGHIGTRIVINNGIQYILSFAFQDGQIQGIYAVANPDKLRHLS
ncbi:RNA polymerase sigma factor SigJ [Paenibacillus radicibacter]|uniref:RNA polymerase sigma factor SigJ n=1 Tax=Paenibacillus radicibacter TaxID=2972488 RepID=UPI002159264B|nr:RNA polymerase sigma factor SigJ [Paenibacillus radicibacter]